MRASRQSLARRQRKEPDPPVAGHSRCQCVPTVLHATGATACIATLRRTQSSVRRRCVSLTSQACVNSGISAGTGTPGMLSASSYCSSTEAPPAAGETPAAPSIACFDTHPMRRRGLMPCQSWPMGCPQWAELRRVWVTSARHVSRPQMGASGRG